MRGGCSVKSCLVHMTTTYHVGYAIMARIVQTVEMHTGGEPLRIIVSGEKYRSNNFCIGMTC